MSAGVLNSDVPTAGAECGGADPVLLVDVRAVDMATANSCASIPGGTFFADDDDVSSAGRPAAASAAVSSKSWAEVVSTSSVSAAASTAWA